ncbi:apoptotic chromatin condensation inducer 1b [Triplophysa dalaica]|uniref:apoptotic chromatin condensation inducer 1b n=1 Tax=Triplophysa dalaica TaxID=1582913 RepID=UPI0024DF93BF|nr:apoptotic chromatin condensation inducer 1b [Triplophysa dalaica]
MAELEDVTLDGKPLHSLRVADLKAALEQRGLAKSGQKNALIKRLKGALMLENLQRSSTHHAGLQPNSQMGEEMSQNSFIKQYLAKQQELLRQRLEREAREATEADEIQRPAGPMQDDHMLTSESTSCLPDKHRIVHSHISLSQAEGGDRGGGLPHDPGLMGSHILDMSPSHLPHEAPDTKAGRNRPPPNFPSLEEVATPSPPRAVASLSVRVVGQPERQGLPLMMPRSQEREGTAPVETGPAQSVLQLSRSARAAAFVQADGDDEGEDDDSDNDDEWGPSSNAKKSVRAPPVQPPPATVPQRSRRKLQPPQHIPPQPQPVPQPPLQLRQPTPPPSPPPELSFLLPDTPKQSPHDQDEAVGPGDGAAPEPGSMPSPPPFKRQDSSSSSRSSSPEPPSTRRPGPLSLLVLKMESEGVFVGGQKVGIEGEMEVEEQEGGKPAEAPEVLMGTNVQTVPQNSTQQLNRPHVSVSVPTMPSVQQDTHHELENKISKTHDEKDEQKRGEEKENEKVNETAAPFHMKASKMFSLKRPHIFSAVPPPESLKSPSKPEQVSVLNTAPTCSEDVMMETETSTVASQSKHSEENKEVKILEKLSPRAEEESIMVPSSHSSSDEGEVGKTSDAHKPRSSTSSQSISDSESSSSHSSSSPSHEKSRPHSQKKDKKTENQKADMKETKTKSPREIKQEGLSEPAGQVTMEQEGRSDSESALQQPDHQEADASDLCPEKSSPAKLIAARKISLSGKTENAAEPVGGANRKRRWGSSTAVTAKRPSISITTESLKTLIPEIKPVLEAVVELHPDEGQLSSEDSAGPHDVDKLEDDQGLKIRRTVTQIVPSDGHENGEKKIENDGDDEDEEEEEDEKWTGGEKEKTRKPERSSDAAMETEVGDAMKVTPNDSLVRRSISQQKSGVSITIDDPIRPSRELSPPRGKTSNIIHVCNLVRPFTLGQLKELLNRTGTLVEEGFWIDKIKSHCYVTYSTTEESMATREALHGVKWPTSNPKVLRVDFCDQDELDFHKGILSSNRAGDGNDPQASGTPNRPAAPKPHMPTHREKKERERDRDGISVMRDQLAERERAMERRESTRSEREWDRGKVKEFGSEDKAGTTRSRSQDRRRRESEKSKEKRTEKKDKPEEPPAKLLDDLFRKTKAAPCIYWLPLTEEQVTQRALERDERKKEREKRRKELQDEEDKKREERRERAKGRERVGGATGGVGAGGGVGLSAEGERDRGKERERERGREGEKRRDASRGNRDGDSKTAGGSRSSLSRSNTSRDRRR